uniref:BppU family phage baseplate upper protein n=1 Tax=Ruminococcus bromii TaxID=40518 RepID=UPI0040286251
MNINHTKMTLEINSCKNYEILEVRQGDKGSRIIDFAFTVNGETVNLTSTMSAKVNATVDDVIVADSVAAVVDTENNVVTVTLTDTMLALSGICKMDIVLTEGDEIITAETVCLRVGKSVINDDSKAFPGASSIAEITKEVETARGSSSTLNARLNGIDSSVSNKAEKSTVSQLSARMQTAEKALAGKANATDIANALKSKEDNSNKVSSKTDVTDSSTNYPSVKYLNDFYYDANETYSSAETDELLKNKADSNSVYSKVEADDLLAEKADKVDVDTSLANKANLVSNSNIFDFDAWAKGLQSLTNPVYRGTLDKVDYTEKSISFTTTEKFGYTNGWINSGTPQSMRIAVKPNTKYLFSWLPSSTNCGAYVFFNGINSDTTRFELKKGFGSFTTVEDTTYILVRFDYYGTGFFKVSEIMITEKESIYLPNKVAEGVPEVANEVLAFEKTTQASLDSKYDSSNIELGTATLTPYSTVADKIKSATCLYEKIGDIVIVNVTVIMNATSLGG